MFGTKKKDQDISTKACPFTFALTFGRAENNPNSKCIMSACQLWDEERKDCGLKQK